MSPTEQEALELRLRQLDFKLEALRWRIEAHARDVAELREQTAQRGQPTQPFPLRKCPP